MHVYIQHNNVMITVDGQEVAYLKANEKHSWTG